MWEFLRKVGVCAPTIERLEPGSIIGIDIMMLMYAEYANAQHELAGAETRELRDAIRAKMHDVDCEIMDVDGMPAAEIYGGDPDAPWIILRRNLANRIGVRLYVIVTSGVVPVLVWDPSILGGKRSVGKVIRTNEKMVLRNVDRAYIYFTLRGLGFPSVIGWTEGEKVLCAGAQGGIIDMVVSGDTDCLVLGAPWVAKYILKSGNDLIVRGVTGRHMLDEVFGNETTNRMLDAGIYLGCDFCRRLPKHGPATLAKIVNSGHPVGYAGYVLGSDNDEYRSEVTRTIEFFIITEEDRNMAVELITFALTNAWQYDAKMSDGICPRIRWTGECPVEIVRGIRFGGQVSVQNEPSMVEDYD